MNKPVIQLTDIKAVTMKDFLRAIREDKPTYLAAPYSDNGKVTERSFLRYRQTQKVFAKLIEAGCNVFSPLDHTHPVSLLVKNRNQVPWLELDKPFLLACNSLIILGLEGWENSKGIAQELRWFQPHSWRVAYNATNRHMFLLKPKERQVRWIRSYEIDGVTFYDRRDH